MTPPPLPPPFPPPGRNFPALYPRFERPEGCGCAGATASPDRPIKRSLRSGTPIGRHPSKTAHDKRARTRAGRDGEGGPRPARRRSSPGNPHHAPSHLLDPAWGQGRILREGPGGNRPQRRAVLVEPAGAWGSRARQRTTVEKDTGPTLTPPRRTSRSVEGRRDPRGPSEQRGVTQSRPDPSGHRAERSTGTGDPYSMARDAHEHDLAALDGRVPLHCHQLVRAPSAWLAEGPGSAWRPALRRTAPHQTASSREPSPRPGPRDSPDDRRPGPSLRRRRRRRRPPLTFGGVP